MTAPRPGRAGEGHTPAGASWLPWLCLGLGVFIGAVAFYLALWAI